MNRNKRRLPAEWEPHEGLLLCFPHNGNDWPGKYEAIQWTLIEFIRKVASFEKVYLLVANEHLRDRVIDMCERAHVPIDQIQFILQKTNRSWMRDSGPIVVFNDGKREALDFNFNGWAKYPNYLLDRKVPERVSGRLAIPLTRVMYKGKAVVLEGGAIDGNGKGSLLTSEECLLHPRIQVRNPDFSKSDYEAVFREFLGVTNVIWMGNGIEGDDTHGHIDDLCRFVNHNTIVTVVEENPRHANYHPLQDNLERLGNSLLEDGKSPNIQTLPMPASIPFEGVRLPASYANFLILNGAVLVPTFNDANDRIALSTIADCFPGREVIGISAIDLIWGFGTLHCLSQQIPASKNR